EIIGLRAGWGLGNALFISTALAAIVGATTGPSAGAIILYETALGIGLAVGPLLGGLLGAVSWRAPFAGTAVLIGVCFLAIPALRTLALTAIFYNFAFFVLLAYSPFPLEAAAAAHGLEFGALAIGGVFFCWGTGLAITSVFVAPLLTRRLGLIPTLLTTLGLL